MQCNSLQNVLIIRQDALGDLVLTTPVYRAVRTKAPNAKLTVMCGPSFGSLFEHNECVKTVLRTGRSIGALRQIRKAASLRRMRFDAAILLKPRSGDHTVLAKLAGIPVRIGNTDRWYGCLLTHNLWADLPHELHEVRRNLMHVEPLLGEKPRETNLEFEPGPPANRRATQLVGNEPFFVVAPTTGGSEAAWGPERFGEVARHVMNSTGMRCMVTGTPGDEPVAGLVCRIAGNKAQSLAGQLSLSELSATLQRSSLIISGSTGALHIAAAHRVPAVVISTMSDSDGRVIRWAPWMTDHESVTPNIPGHLKTKLCGEDREVNYSSSIETHTVIEAFERLWSRQSVEPEEAIG